MTPAKYKADWKNEAWTELLVKSLQGEGKALLAVHSIQYWVMLFSALARHESNFDPTCTYTEKFPDAKGKPVVSRGLLQISKESANGYGAGLVKEEELHDVATNLRCGVLIAAKWVVKDGVVYGGDAEHGWKGMARYWSQFRKPDVLNLMMRKVKEATA